MSPRSSTATGSATSSKPSMTYDPATLDLGWTKNIEPRLELSIAEPSYHYVNGGKTLQMHFPKSVTAKGPTGERVSMSPSKYWVNATYDTLWDSIGSSHQDLVTIANGLQYDMTSGKAYAAAKASICCKAENTLRTLLSEAQQSDFSPTAEGSQSFETGACYTLRDSPKLLDFEVVMDASKARG